MPLEAVPTSLATANALPSSLSLFSFPPAAAAEAVGISTRPAQLIHVDETMGRWRDLDPHGKTSCTEVGVSLHAMRWIAGSGLARMGTATTAMQCPWSADAR